jgi:hypothetical protein
MCHTSAGATWSLALWYAAVSPPQALPLYSYSKPPQQHSSGQHAVLEGALVCVHDWSSGA